MDTLLYISYLYLLVLLLATFIERVMEILMSVYQYLEFRLGWDDFWNRRAERIARLLSAHIQRRWLERILPHRDVPVPFQKYLLDEKGGHSDKVIILSADLVRQIAVATAARFVATALGILFCVLTRIDLISIFNRDLGYRFLDQLPYGFRIAVSGAVIGLGAEPVHKLIVAVERRRKKKKARIQREKLEAAKA